MSDVDRLREAADALDDGGIHGQREWPEDDLCICGLDWDVQHRRDAAAAPLLRAVADESSNIEWITRTMSDGHPSLCVSDSWKAVLTLADTILGDGEHQHRWRGVVDGSEYCEECGKERWTGDMDV